MDGETGVVEVVGDRRASGEVNSLRQAMRLLLLL